MTRLTRACANPSGLLACTAHIVLSFLLALGASGEAWADTTAKTPLRPGYLDLEHDPGEAASGAAVLFELLENKLRFGEYSEALEPAEQMVELTAVEFGPRSAELAEPMINLGQVQELAGLNEEAETTYTASIALIEERYGGVDRRLIRPYAGLARLDLDAGRYDKAIENFDQARYLLRRNDGLYNLDQAEFLDGISSAYLQSGEPLEAHRKQFMLLELYQREYGEDSPELVPALMNLGHWLGTLYLTLTYSNQNQYACLVERNFNMSPDQPYQCRSPGQRDVYKAAIEILEKNYGPDDPRLIEPLLALADTYYYLTKQYVQQEFSSGFYDFDRPPASFRPPVRQEGRGLAALQKALDIARANPEQASDKEIDILVEMGDWHMIYRRSSDYGVAFYLEAWKRIAEGPGGAELANQAFAQPQRLFFLDSSPPIRRGSMGYRTTLYETPPEAVEGHATLLLDVTAQGQAENVTIVEAETDDPQGRAQRELRAVSDAMFRPRIVDGQAVDAKGIRMVQPFAMPF